MSPSAMPEESPFTQHIFLIRTRNLTVKKRQPWWLYLCPCPTILPTSPRLTTSLETEGWNKCSPPQQTPHVRSAGSSATSPTTVPAHYPSVRSAHSLTQKQSIVALTLPALRVLTSHRSSAAACPWWRAVLTAKKRTLRAGGIAHTTQKPPQMHQRCHLDRRRTAWISLKTRLAL